MGTEPLLPPHPHVISWQNLILALHLRFLQIYHPLPLTDSPLQWQTVIHPLSCHRGGTRLTGDPTGTLVAKANPHHRPHPNKAADRHRQLETLQDADQPPRLPPLHPGTGLVMHPPLLLLPQPACKVVALKILTRAEGGLHQSSLPVANPHHIHLHLHPCATDIHLPLGLSLMSLSPSTPSILLRTCRPQKSTDSSQKSIRVKTIKLIYEELPLRHLSGDDLHSERKTAKPFESDYSHTHTCTHALTHTLSQLDQRPEAVFSRMQK